MTLVITELSQFGIVMVADSAVTETMRLPSGRVVNRVLNGVQKLHVVEHLKAGLSVWGRGSIPTPSGELSTDIWLMDFIERYKAVTSIDEFASILSGELQNTFGGRQDLQDIIGIHLAGHVEKDGDYVPTFYHIRNNDGDFRGYTPHDFIPGHDFPPQKLEVGKGYITRNGDYGPYALLSAGTQAMLPYVYANLNLAIPHPSLQGRLAYHRAWVSFISELYASSGLLQTIGGTVAALAIFPDGNMLHLPG